MRNAFSKIDGSWRNRLTVRFSIVIGFALLVMSCLATWVSVQLERHSLVEHLEDQAIRFADLFAANVAASLFTFNRENIDTVVTGFGTDQMIRFLEVRDSSGKIIAVKGSPKEPGESVTVSRDVRYAKQPVGKVSISLSTESVDAAVQQYWWRAAVREGLGLLLVSLVLTALVRREVSQPIQHVADCLRDIAHGEGDLTKRIDHAAQNEIGAMAQWFNEFADKLSLIIIQVREATAAVSDAAGAVIVLGAGIVARHERTSGVGGGNHGQPGRDACFDHAKRRELAPDGTNRGQGRQGREGVRDGRRRVCRCDENHCAKNFHRRGDRLPDQSSRSQCRDRGCARGRTRQGLCCGCDRSPKTRRTEPNRGARNRCVNRVQCARRRALRRAFRELVPAIRNTAELVQEVATASKEQAAGVAQVNRAMIQVDQVTQRNASAAEELSSTAEEMNNHAESLQELIALFRTAAPLAPRSTPAPKKKPRASAASRGAGSFESGAETNGGFRCQRSGQSCFKQRPGLQAFLKAPFKP